MLGIGWGEMLVIAIVLLIVVGPKDLPMMLRNIGRAMGTVRRMSNEFRREIDKAVAADELREAKKAITDPLQKTSSEISREFNSIRNGKFEPSGKLKPSNPNTESVGDDIRARAGLPPAKANAAAAASVSAEKPVPEKPVPAIGNAGTTSAGDTVKASKPATKSAPKNGVTSRASSTRAKAAAPSDKTAAKSKSAAKPKAPAKAEDTPKAPRKTAREKKATPPKAETSAPGQAPGGEG